MCLKGRPFYRAVFLASALLFFRDARTGKSYSVNEWVSRCSFWLSLRKFRITFKLDGRNSNLNHLSWPVSAELTWHIHSASVSSWVFPWSTYLILSCPEVLTVCFSSSVVYCMKVLSLDHDKFYHLDLSVIVQSDSCFQISVPPLLTYLGPFMFLSGIYNLMFSVNFLIRRFSYFPSAIMSWLVFSFSEIHTNIQALSYVKSDLLGMCCCLLFKHLILEMG